MNGHVRIAFLPMREDDPITIWSVNGGHISIDGTFPSDSENTRCVALAAPGDCVIRWHDFDGLAPRQAVAAARLAAADASIDPAALHIIADAKEDATCSCSIDRDAALAAVERLKQQGFDPDHIWPIGLILPDKASAVRLSLGDVAVVRAGKMILPDDTALVAQIIGDQKIDNLSLEDFAQMLTSSPSGSVVDLRQGILSKKTERHPVDKGKLALAVFAIALALVLSLLLAVSTWVKTAMAVSREDAAAVAAAQQIIPSVQTAEQAAAELERRSATTGDGQRSFTAALAAVWKSVQRVEGSSLRDVRFGRDRVLSVTLVAANADPINTVLIDLQREGYKVTATPRQESNGTIAALVTVRAP